MRKKNLFISPPNMAWADTKWSPFISSLLATAHENPAMTNPPATICIAKCTSFCTFLGRSLLHELLALNAMMASIINNWYWNIIFTISVFFIIFFYLKFIMRNPNGKYSLLMLKILCATFASPAVQIIYLQQMRSFEEKPQRWTCVW